MTKAEREARQSAIISRFAAIGLTVSADSRVPGLLVLDLNMAETIANWLEAPAAADIPVPETEG
jgi:hypothetical protein